MKDVCNGTLKYILEEFCTESACGKLPYRSNDELLALISFSLLSLSGS